MHSKVLIVEDSDYYLCLEKKHERDLMNEQIRNQHLPTKISKFEVNYYFF